MHYYIYPKGGSGLSIAWMIDFFNDKEKRNDTYEFIDDSSEQDSLAAKHKIINSQGGGQDEFQVLLASYRFQDKLIENLKKYNLHTYYDGIHLFGSKINEYFLKTTNPLNNVGILMDDYKSQKHLGEIDKKCKNRDYKIIYFHFINSYEIDSPQGQNRGDDINIYITIDFLVYFEFTPFIIGTGLLALGFLETYYNLSQKVSFLAVFNHFFVPNYHSFYHSKIQLSIIANAYNRLSNANMYISCSHKQSLLALETHFQTYNGNINFLKKLGYPSLDKEIDNFHKCNYVGTKDTIILLSYLQKHTKNILDTLITNGYRVIFKTVKLIHPECATAEKNLIKPYLNNKNFIFYTEPNLSPEELHRSITLIEFRSSMLYTYPIITKKPSIIMQPPKEWFDEHPNVEDNFYNEKLQIKCFDTDEMLQTIELLKQKDFQEKRKAMIEDFCKNDAYNVGNASEKIAEFIDSYFKDRKTILEQYYKDYLK